MTITKCSIDNSKDLAILNKQLIEDENSDNRMSITELEDRMKGFLMGNYHAYYFTEGNHVL